MMQECIFMFREIKHLTLNVCKNSTFHKKKQITEQQTKKYSEIIGVRS